MTERAVAVLVRPSESLPAALVSAMVEDVIDLVTDTPLVEPMLAVTDGPDSERWQDLTWPGTTIVAMPGDPSVGEALAAVGDSAALGVLAIAVLVADVPDLPTLLLGKLFSALAGSRGAAVAICPAEAGGLVAVAANLPVAPWLAALGEVRFDDPDALEAVRAAATPGQLSVGPGWRRVRHLTDTDHLDPGLEGWDHTRAYLA